MLHFFVIWWETPSNSAWNTYENNHKNSTLQWMNCRFFNVVNIFLFSDFNLSKTNLYHILVMLLLQSTKWMHLRILRLILIYSCCTSLLVTAAAAGKKNHQKYEWISFLFDDLNPNWIKTIFFQRKDVVFFSDRNTIVHEWILDLSQTKYIIIFEIAVSIFILFFFNKVNKWKINCGKRNTT